MATDNMIDLNQLLNQAHNGEIEVAEFMSLFLQTQIFMPVTDPKDDSGSAPIGFQKSDRAQPLVLDTDDAFSVMILFSDPQQSKGFLQDFPEYSGGFIAEVPWMLERLGEGMGLSLNPGLENGIDFDPETIQQLITLQHQLQQ